MFGWSTQPSGRIEAIGPDATTSNGVLITTHASSGNTKGSWVDVGTTTFDYEALTVMFGSADIADFLFDVGIGDGAGNYWVLIENLRLSTLKSTYDQSVSITFPLHVPAGSLLAARAQSAVANKTFRISFQGAADNAGGAPGYSRCVGIGPNTATSRGPAVDPGGTAHTKGAYTELVASLAVDIAAIVLIAGSNNDIVRSASATSFFDLAVGAAGAEAVVIPNQYQAWGSSYDNGWMQFRGPYAIDIPAGSRVAARSQCSLNTAGDRTIDITAYGLVR